MRYFVIFTTMLIFTHCVFANPSLAVISNDVLLEKLNNIETAVNKLTITVENNKTTSDSKMDQKCDNYDNEISNLKQRITRSETQLWILWGIIGLGGCGGSIYGGIKYQQKKDGAS